MNNGEEMDNTTEHQSQSPSIKGLSKAVLVTGGAGYVGSHTCKFLAKNGFTPITIDRMIDIMTGKGEQWRRDGRHYRTPVSEAKY